MTEPKRHFLVVAAASRGGRFFVKKALEQGHDVTAICRAEDDPAALRRMQKVLAETKLTAGGVPASQTAGKLQARSCNILDLSTYKNILESDPNIDAICCFVGVTKMKEMLDRKQQLYTKTIRAIVGGMRQSRWVEFFYHGSVGSEGVPGKSVTAWPKNYPALSFLTQIIFPVFKDVTKSENILADCQSDGLEFVIFRPAQLKDGRAKRRYGFTFDTTGMDKADLSLKQAETSISREDVAEEILRVSTLPKTERKHWHGHGVYLVDMKDGYMGS